MPKIHKPKLPAILLCDEHLLIVDKPAGVLSAPGRGDAGTVADLLRGREGIPEDEPFRIVHRLDKDASGVLTYARTLEAQQRVTEQFVQRTADKRYLALVTGYVTEDQAEIDVPLVYNKRQGQMEAHERRGKPARTCFRVIERIAGNTLVECRPITGRTHQIRVHMAWYGHPLSVDPLYGGGEAIFLSTFKQGYRPSGRRPERPLIARLTLHARELTLRHPATGEPVTVTTEPPRDFAAALSQLSRLV